MKTKLSEMSWEALTVYAREHDVTDAEHHIIESEFLRREVLLQKEMTKAAKDTAKFTKENARYMLWSSLALSASAVVQVLVLLLPYVIKLFQSL